MNFVLASCSVPSEGPFGHEKTERRLRKLGQVYAEGTAPLPHYAPGAESLSEVRGVGTEYSFEERIRFSVSVQPVLQTLQRGNCYTGPGPLLSCC